MINRRNPLHPICTLFVLLVLVVYFVPSTAQGSCTSNEVCTAGGHAGICVSISDGCCAGGTATPNLCPGNTDIQCCVEPSCSTPAGSGTCTSSEECAGEVYPGYCAGPSDITCCITTPACNTPDGPGTCMSASECLSTPVPGYCAGSSDIQCCLSNSTDINYESQQKPLCDFIAATNIANISGFGSWECNATGYVETHPCSWNGTVCSGGLIIDLSLGSIGLQGTLPLTLGSMTALENIYFNSNYLHGPLPSSIACLHNLLFLDLFDNHLSSTIPPEINYMSGLTRVDVSFNLLSGTVPPIGNLTSMTRLQMGNNLLNGTMPDFSLNTELFLIILNANSLTGTLPTALAGLAPKLGYFYCDKNYLDGSIPTSYGSLTEMEFFDIALNLFTGTIPTTIGMMSKLQFFKIPENPGITGPIPTSVGQLTSLVNMHLDYTGVSGVIPSQLCDLQQDVTVDVTNTNIHCFGGCLTSQNVNIKGATTVCPNGSILRKFLIILSVFVAISLCCTIYYYRFGEMGVGVGEGKDAPDRKPMWSALLAMAAMCGSCVSDQEDSSRCAALVRYIQEGLKRIHKSLFRNTLAISFYKVLVMLFISLFVERYWTFCGLDISSASATEVESCTSEYLGTCRSYCSGAVTETLFTISDDVYQSHLSEQGYCTAALDGSCACRYWLVYKLVPLVLSVLQFVLQFACMVCFDSFDPQRVQYELLAKHVLSFIGDGAGTGWTGASQKQRRGSTWRQSVTTGFVDSVQARSKGFRTILMLFFRDPLYCFFSGIEVFTVTYVWMELTFSPVSCGNQFRLSRLYYPMVLTVLDFGKLNFYIALRSWRLGQFARAATSLLNIQIFFIYVVISTILAFVFVGGILKSSVVAVATGVNRLFPGTCSRCIGSNANTAHTGSTGAGGLDLGGPGDAATDGETVNAMHMPVSIYFKNFDDADADTDILDMSLQREVGLADLELQTPRQLLQKRQQDGEISAAEEATSRSSEVQLMPMSVT